MTEASRSSLDEVVAQVDSSAPPLTGGAVPDGYLLRTRFLRYEYHDEENACSPQVHAHPEHVVFWPERGSATLEVDGIRRSITLGHGLWVPAGIPHRASRDDTTLAALHITPNAWTGKTSATVRAMTMIPALRELLTHIAYAGITKEQRVRAQHVCLDLISDEPGPMIDLPIPHDPRIADICRRLLADPTDDRSIDEWAQQHSTSSRTLARAFRSTTGMTFSQWRTCARMAQAIEHLGEGMPVGTVARRVGYSTIAAFSTAFHRVLGRPPHEFHPVDN
ncbi:AraC family transcriptional regulator [Microbacterium betulae]|uniref:HTH-type transcriptional regulator RipA n=1 Tax=Microbacterium betulae TaxID=2981139 RepID=A0AA97I6Q9_9MICO|nr:AraC family transcriptional regulator [Microbacterium sp. AB]WOF24104.1 AraC family transcriptional regulator [Microbacterium sp. AB]